jgi:hypothetical protein
MKKSGARVRSWPAKYRSALKFFAYLGKPEVIDEQSERRDGTAPSVPHVRNSRAGSVAAFCSRKLTVSTSRLLTIRAILSHVIMVSANRMKLGPWRLPGCEKLGAQLSLVIK